MASPSSPRHIGRAVLSGVLCSLSLWLGCFPQDDLSSYSSEYQPNQPGDTAGAGGTAGSPGELPDASAGGGAAGTGSNGGGSDLDAGPEPVDAGDAGPPSADAGPGDAGPVDAGAPPVDGGVLVLDAGAVLEAQCAALDGTLEPGTRSCLVVSTSMEAWQDAEDACDALGMALVAIESEERDELIATLTPGPVWIGGRDPAFFTFPAFANPAANVFNWLDGTVVADINWATGEPDAAGGQFCIEKSNGTGEPWFDRDCSEEKLYVCEAAL